MELETKKRFPRKLLGQFILIGGSSSCIIFNRAFGSQSLNYLGDSDNDYQIIIPTDLFESGYILAAVQHPIELIDEKGNRFDYTSPLDPEIPVYAEYKNELLKRISIEIASWIVQEQNITLQRKNSLPPAKTKQLNRKLLGYVTTTGSAIVICDMDMVHLSRDCAAYENQLIDEMEGEDPSPLRVGVQVNLPIENREIPREYPVYGEYEGETLKRITIEIVDNN